jgi:hypothetical protein
VKHHMHSSRNYIYMLCSIQTHRHIGMFSMKFHINYLCNLVVTVYICSIPFKRHSSTSSYGNIIKPKPCQASCHACHTSFFVFFSFLFLMSWGFIPTATHLFFFFFYFLLMSWSFIPTDLTLALISMCHGTRTPGFLSAAVGLYTDWSYTCSAKISFNLGLTFSINDFILCSCSSHLILFMIMLSYIYASYNFICFSIPFQIHHENIILNSFKII